MACVAVDADRRVTIVSWGSVIAGAVTVLACCSQDVGARVRGEAIEEPADGFDEGADCPGRVMPQQRLELGEGHRDGARQTRSVMVAHRAGKDMASVVDALLRQVQRLTSGLMASPTWARHGVCRASQVHRRH